MYLGRRVCTGTSAKGNVGKENLEILHGTPALLHVLGYQYRFLVNELRVS